MNKLSYRIVYNASRGQLMAVSEASQSDHGGTPSSERKTAGVRRAAGQPLVTRPLSWAMWLALGMVSVVGSAQAGPTQIVVDPNAAAANRPTVGTGVNGNGTVVNIQTPSAAGVSRNVYKQFDVGAEGVVLNNSRTGQRTQVAGPVAGNRSMVKGTAKVILNEVNGPAGSQLNGTLEVSGDRAQVIIANPAGVTCDGCGFINAKRVTLTTGTPVVNGGALEGYRVEQGTTKIGPGGMNTGSADYTDIISRAVVVEGKVQARELRVITGANEVSADGSRITPMAGKGPKPEYAIDSSELGGMYAKKITLISTEAGVGVRRAGNLGASAGDVRISADGSILGTGTIQSAGDIVIAGQNIAQSGSIQSRGNVRLSSRNKLEVGSGVIVSKGDTTLEAPVMTVSSDAMLVAGLNDDGAVSGSSQLKVSGGSFQSKGKHVVAGDFDIQAKTVDLADSTSQVGMSLAINAEESLTTDRAKVLADRLLLAAWVLSNRGGQIVQTGSQSSALRLRELDNTEGTLLVRGDTVLDLGKLDNTKGLIGVTAGGLEIRAPGVVNREGSIEADGDLKIRSKGLIDNEQGRLLSSKSVEITDLEATRSLRVQGKDGTIMGREGVTLKAASYSGDGTLLTEGTLTVDLQSGLRNTGHMAGTVANVFVAGGFSNAGTLEADEFNLRSQSVVNEGSGQILANKGHITADTLSNQGLVDVGQLRVDANQTVNSGRIYGNEVSLGGGTLRNEKGGVIAARVQLDLGVAHVENEEGSEITSAGSMRIGGSLDAQGHAVGRAQSLSNSSGLVEAEDRLDMNVAQTTNKRSRFEMQERVTTLDLPSATDPEATVHTETTESVVTQASEAGTIRADTVVIQGAIVNDKSRILGVDVQYDSNQLTQIGAESTRTTRTVTQNSAQGSGEEIQTTKTELVEFRPLISASANLLQTNKEAKPAAASGVQPAGAAAAAGPQAASPAATPAAAPGEMSAAPINLSLPLSKQYSASASGQSLVQTDARLGGYKTWVGSDVQTAALGVDPQTKRLGDAQYEQRLVADQVQKLTGRILLDGSASSEDQYRALLDAGTQAGKELGLQVGKPLTAEQVKGLKQDIVWMEAREVTLPSGQKVQALVPQVYARVDASMPTQVKLDKGQGLASGRTVTVDMSGTYLQKDNVLATESLVMRADDLRLQGQLMSRDISLQATHDVVNEGVQVIAGRDLQVTAGRDILASSVVNGGQITQLAAFAAGNTESGQLVLSAGGDIRTEGALVQNLSKGATKLQAGQDVVLGTVSVTQKTSTAQGRNRRDVSVTQDVGSQVVSQGDILVEAGRDIVGKAAAIQSAEGAVAALAGRDMQFSAGEKVTITDDLTLSTKRRWFKKVSTATHTVTSETRAVESSVGGTSVSMQSGQDIHLTGSAVAADQKLQLVAARDVTLDPKHTQTIQTVDVSRKTSGLFKSGPMALTLGTKRENTHSVAEAVNQVGTRVGSLNGDVVIQAGRNFKQEGSHVMAPHSDVQVVAQKIDVVEAANTLTQSQDVTVKTSGGTVSESFALVTMLQTANQMAHAGKDADDSRMEALAALSAGLSAYNALTQPTWSGSVMVGSSQMSSHSEQSAQSGVASTIAAKNLTLMAVSDPANPGDFKPTAGRDVTIRGSQIKVSGSAEVVAEGKIDLLASQDQASMSSSNQSESSGVGLGASLGPKGMVAGVKVEGSLGQGQAQGQSLTNRNTTIEAGEVASFKSGGDMRVKGAVVSAKQIVADVGGSLELESLQDKRSYQSEQSSVSGSATVGTGASVTASVSDSRLRHEFTSVGEQSGLRAGDGGFQINAAGGIQLTGAQITSTQAAVDQHLNVVNAPSIEYADVQNKLETKGQAYSVSVTLGTTGPGFSGGFGHINDHEASVSRAGISGFGGQDSARTGDASTSLKNDFDASKAQAKLAAQVSITQTLSKEAPQAVANFAEAQKTQAKQQYEAAANERDPQVREQKEQEAKERLAAWDEGGRYRVAMHVAMGAAGAGWQGALGAGAAAGAAPTMDKLQKNLRDELTPILGDTAAVFVSQGLIQLTTGAAGATLGGMQGAQWATTVDVNNRQLHTIEKERLRREARKLAESAPEQSRQEAENYWYRLLYQTANAGADDQAAAELGAFKAAVEASNRAPSEQTPYVLEGYYKAGALLRDYQVASDTVARLAEEKISMTSPYGDGAQLTAFRATEQEKANPNYLGSEERSQKAKYERVNEGVLKGLYTINGSAEPSYADIDAVMILFPAARAAFESTSAVRTGSRAAAESGGKAAGAGKAGQAEAGGGSWKESASGAPKGSSAEPATQLPKATDATATSPYSSRDMSYGKTTMTDVEGNPIPTSMTVNELKGYSAIGSGERAAGNVVKGEVGGVAGKPLGVKAGGAEAAANSGASSLVNGWRLNMQVTAEQAAGARMPAQIGEYSEHALQQIAGRDGGVGVSKSSLLDAWTNPIKIDYVPTKYGPTFRLTGNDAAIVVNLDGKVVTGWATSSKGTGK